METNTLLDILDINKASGPDLINYKMLKYVSTAVSKPLTVNFNHSLMERHYPEPWKTNNVVPLFKKGETDKPSNYRPVSLSSPAGKVIQCVGFKNIIIGPRQANLVLIAYAISEGSGEPAHPRRLARTFAARSYKQ